MEAISKKIERLYTLSKKAPEIYEIEYTNVRHEETPEHFLEGAYEFLQQTDFSKVPQQEAKDKLAILSALMPDLGTEDVRELAGENVESFMGAYDTLGMYLLETGTMSRKAEVKDYQAIQGTSKKLMEMVGLVVQ